MPLSSGSRTSGSRTALSSAPVALCPGSPDSMMLPSSPSTRMPCAFLSIACTPHGFTPHTKSPVTSSTQTRSTVAVTAKVASAETSGESSRISPLRQSNCTTEFGPRRTTAAASPAIARKSPPSMSSPGTLAVSSMPPADTHHRSSFAPTQPQSLGGPGTCARISLGSASVSSERHAPSPSRARRPETSTTSGTLPTSESNASLSMPSRVRCGPADVVRTRSPSTSDQTDPSGATCVAVPASTANEIGSPSAGTTLASSSSGLTTTRPACPTPDSARPAPRAVSPNGVPRRSSTESIARASAVVSLSMKAPGPPSATDNCSSWVPASRLANARPP